MAGRKSNKRALKFAQRLRQEHSIVPNARDVLGVEDELGAQAVSFQLSPRGKRALFRALDRERSAKLNNKDE